MSPTELFAKIKMLADNPPGIEPFTKAATRAVAGAQADLARFNGANATSFAVDASQKAVTVRWRSTPMPGHSASLLSPSAAIKGHLAAEMRTAKAEFQDDLGERLSS